MNTYSVGFRFSSKEDEHFKAKSTEGHCFWEKWTVCKA